jgi:hypothetical protein
MRPVKGTLGNAARTLDIRSPRQEYFDVSISKDIAWPFFSKEGKRRVNLRVDLLNAFNHPNFRYNNTGNTPFGLGTFPTELTGETAGTPAVAQAITIADYNTWANSWNAAHPADTVPLQSTATGAAINSVLQGIRNNINATRQTGNNGPNTGGLPLDFYHIQLPQGFATTNALSFDLRNLQGYKLYRIRQTYQESFGSLFAIQSGTGGPRYIQFGIRIFF